ncbi:phosphotransferase family protein [Cellulomonas palmilytica]|uniref:phosphotransferase family protein n=1 Tax=Cellulomonas palmilytica TaxID=2608402 RepID=UPI001F1F6D57|nr:aminoglycoside phosphotransferase family protein [Cellulomonas palmilytica]UJP40148.1 aminoglycoside phosphotransferase family protein [Cellulomonas palmilytica]
MTEPARPDATRSRPGGRAVRAPDEAAAFAVLTGPQAGDLLAAALGTTSERLEWRVDAVHHRPGDGVTVGYVVAQGGHGGDDGGDHGGDHGGARSGRGHGGAHGAGTRHGGTVEYLLASSSRSAPRDAPGVLVAHGPAGEVLVWRHPDDPMLPALRRACDPGLLAQALPGDWPVSTLELVGYRPLRRAVVRAERDGVTWYVKVLRPRDGHADDVVARHLLLGAAGVPVPRVAYASDDGLVVLEALGGTPLLDVLVAGRTPALAVVLEVLARFPADALALPERRPWSSRARAYASALEVRPALAGRAHAVAAGVRAGLRSTDAGPVVPTHGDLHEGQLLVDGSGRVTGLLDVDTVGPGHLVDDVACLLAHVHAVHPSTPTLGDALRRWADEARAFVDLEALRVRVAGVLLSLAAGAVPVGADEPHTDSERLLTAAEAWLP